MLLHALFLYQGILTAMVVMVMLLVEMQVGDAQKGRIGRA
jgi:hypothetical protein